MNKKLIISILVIGSILGIGVTALAINSNKQTNFPPSDKSSSQGSPITVTGKMTCLSPKDTSGPANASCAIGLEGDDGKSYALNADDPALTGSVPTGKRVKVTGSFTEKTSQYDSVGVIKVDTLQQL